uniref:DNA topoisomerase I n=1 Tax=Lepisosteus oculatus TaxID=7918 RepID=W5MPB0_LEPOC|nr:PREDICTED: DNA topoisomerase I, mitochondrial isoform X1 [Lepisosteus oculatus]XP_015209607.1 PREDICTED: DNA topoisomerase I, mitochondrial isoform X1 [Lepisosteus oculatus]
MGDPRSVIKEDRWDVRKDIGLLNGELKRKGTSSHSRREQNSSDRKRKKDTSQKSKNENKDRSSIKRTSSRMEQEKSRCSEPHGKSVQEHRFVSYEKSKWPERTALGNSEDKTNIIMDHSSVSDDDMEETPGFLDMNNNISAVSREERHSDRALCSENQNERSEEKSDVEKNKMVHKVERKEKNCKANKTRDGTTEHSDSQSDPGAEEEDGNNAMNREEIQREEGGKSRDSKMDKPSKSGKNKVKKEKEQQSKFTDNSKEQRAREKKIDEAEERKRRKLHKGKKEEDGNPRRGDEKKKDVKKSKIAKDEPEEGGTAKKRKRENREEENKEKKLKKEEQEKKKQEEEANKWKWWEEGQSSDGTKWQFLEHKGPLFASEYEPLPENVKFYYSGKPVKLSLTAEEVAVFYAKMLDHEYTTKEVFQKNFFHDWKQEMTAEEQSLIKDLSKCDFKEIHQYFEKKTEEKKAMTKEGKQALKKAAEMVTEEYGYCLLDGHREKIGNFKIEPPGLFRGRGDHPKMGKLKRRIQPEDVIINCSKESKIPVPPQGHKWKKVQHDNTVTWLASWVENVQGGIKYIMLNPSSKLKGEKDWKKYEVARKLKDKVDMIRHQYRQDWKAREMKRRQRGVAIYFIDKLALRAGNEKEEGETADTVGCCSLRVEHITLHRRLDGQDHVVVFDFLGKDSIRYCNQVPVEKAVFKNLKLFMDNKNPDDDLFDRITTSYLNKSLQESMDGLTAKVFRTYNASFTLQQQLNKLTDPDQTVAEKILAYNRANRAVAILCNHQRAAPKTFEKSMQNIQEKIAQKEQQLEDAKKDLKKAQEEYNREPSDKLKKLVEKKEKLVKRLEEQLKKLILQATDREENKQIALGTSKLNYLDPRITVAWCKKYGVPIEKVYNKTQRDKFAWAIDMTEEDYEF